MIIAVPRETFPGERRVSLIPASVAGLSKAGHEVRVERGAGAAAGFPDPEYEERGARLVSSREELLREADLIAFVRGPGANGEWGGEDFPHFREGQIVLGFLDPLSEPAAMQQMAALRVTAFSMELIPRITRAQSMDALSSMATIAGYKAVLMAANLLPRMFPMMMTAAGTLTPARVLIVGAGVAGLQAIATARRLGAVVQAYDVRPAVKEQVESLGARFVELPIEAATGEAKGGYAAAQDEEFYRRQRELMTRVVAESDVLITTAAVPGKKAPVLVTADMTRVMAPGSVVVDLAAERGGNCELTRPGETTVENGVTIIGPLNVPSEIPYHASQMYARNVTTFIGHLAPKGVLNLNTEDEILRETMVTHQGAVVHARVREML